MTERRSQPSAAPHQGADALREALQAVQMDAVKFDNNEHAITTETLKKVEQALGEYSLTVPAKDRKSLGGNMPDDAKALIRQAIQTLTVPAAEYVPAIPDAWSLLERAIAALAHPARVPLTREQIEPFWHKHCHAIGPIAVQDFNFATAIQSACAAAWGIGLETKGDGNG